MYYVKVVINDAELDGTPFLAPETRGGFCFIVAFSKKARLEEIVGQDAGMERL